MSNSPSTTRVKLISECFIKPKNQQEVLETVRIHEKKSSSSKPIYLTPWDLSLLNHNYIQKGLLFHHNRSSTTTTLLLISELKEALSVTLPHFYPLTGQLETHDYHKESEQDHLQSISNGLSIFIDPCKGPGVRFIHASLKLTVSDLLSSPTHNNEHDVPTVVKFLFDHDGAVVNHDGHFQPLLSVQVTELVDGGIFIGCSMNHAVGDGTSYWHFWNSWSEIFMAKLNTPKGQNNNHRLSRPPVHTRLFLDGSGENGIKLPFTHPDEFVRRYEAPNRLRERIFRFSSESIRKNKERANSEANNMNNNVVTISSFQALSALVWRCITRARGRGKQSNYKVAATTLRLAINNRSRLDPPLTNNYFGVCVQMIQLPTLEADELLNRSLGWTALKLNQAVRAHDDEAVRGWVERWVRARRIEGPGSAASVPGVVTISSSPRFDMYGNEFGVLGKPICVLSGYGNKYDGTVISYAGKEGGGSVDLEICLLPDIMCALESDQEFMDAVYG